MARNGKIDSGGPNKAMNFLKKNIQTLPIDSRIGRSVERDIIDFDIAKKACEKASVEGKVIGIDSAISIVYTMTERAIDGRTIIQALQILKDRTLAQSV